jgi:hypothetical protein
MRFNGHQRGFRRAKPVRSAQDTIVLFARRTIYFGDKNISFQTPKYHISHCLDRGPTTV